jgi:hypothetical protein
MVRRVTPGAMEGARWRPLPDERWDAIVAASPGASGFQSRAWFEARARFRPKYEARCLGLELSSGETVALPLLVRKGVLRQGLLGRAVANTEYAYGGPLLAGRHLGDRDWREIDAARSPLGRIDVPGNPHEPAPAWLVERDPLLADRTHVIALDRDPLEGFEPSARRAVRKAEREGVTVERESGAGALAAYRAILDDTVRRWGPDADQGEPWDVVEAVLASPCAELWLARSKDGRAAAGGVFLLTPAIALYWHGAMLAELAELRPANALHAAVLRDAREKGRALYDLGRDPTGGGEGVRRFKRSLGAREVELRGWRRRSARLGTSKR